MKNYYRIIPCPIGTLLATCHDTAITSVDFTDTTDSIGDTDHPLLVQLEKELDEYIARVRHDYTLPLDPSGTPLQKEVWKTLQTIPYGITISYAQEAKRFGNPKAVRAVANANGRNPISILIPCHRVIASGGRIGGYSGGVWKKEFLLKLEQSNQ